MKPSTEIYLSISPYSLFSIVEVGETEQVTYVTDRPETCIDIIRSAPNLPIHWLYSEYPSDVVVYRMGHPLHAFPMDEIINASERLFGKDSTVLPLNTKAQRREAELRVLAIAL